LVSLSWLSHNRFACINAPWWCISSWHFSSMQLPMRFIIAAKSQMSDEQTIYYSASIEIDV
jgi:hypothetical protein